VAAEQPAGAEAAIAETSAAFASALERGDAGAAAKAYTERATLLPPATELVQGREAIEAFWTAGIATGIRSIVLETVEVASHGRSAHEIGRYVLELVSRDGGVIVDRGNYLLVHELQNDGTWLRAAEMFTPGGPPARHPEPG